MSYPFGIHTDMSNEEYHALKEVDGIPVISSTMVKDVLIEDIYYAFNKPEIKNQAILDVGTALHSLFLEGHMPICGGKTRATKEYKEAVEEAQRTNRIALPQADYERVIGMHQAMLNNKTMAKLKKRKHIVENSFFCSPTPKVGTKKKFILKARPDMYTGKGQICIDVKTGPKPEPYRMDQHIERMRWHVQAAFYKFVMELLNMPVQRFMFFCVERDYPHRTQVIELTKDVLDVGQELAFYALEKITEAHVTGIIKTGWPDIHKCEFEWMEHEL